MSSDWVGLDQVLVAREVYEAELAAVAFLARYSGRTLEAYRQDLRFYFAWAESVELEVLAATRRTSSCTVTTWNNAGSQHRRSIGGWRRCAACTDSRTSTVGSHRTPPSTCDDRRCTRARDTEWTAPNSAGSCFTAEHSRPPTGRAGGAARTQRACESARHATPTSAISASSAGTARCGSSARASKPAVIPLVPRTARTMDLAIGERREGPILLRHDGQRLDRRTAHRWVKAIGKRAGLGHVHPHMLRAAFIMAALDAGVPLRDVQLAARHADPRTTTIYDRRRQNFDRHAAYVVVAFVAGA